MTCAEYVQTAVLAITACIVLWYTIETARLRREMTRQNKIALRPVVVPEFRLADGKYSLVLENCGNGCAVNIRVLPLETHFDGNAGARSFREELRFKPRSYYLASGQECLIDQDVYSAGAKMAESPSEHVYRPDRVGPDLVFNVAFADVEGGSYSVRAILVGEMDPKKLPRELRLEALEQHLSKP